MAAPDGFIYGRQYLLDLIAEDERRSNILTGGNSDSTTILFSMNRTTPGGRKKMISTQGLSSFTQPHNNPRRVAARNNIGLLYQKTGCATLSDFRRVYCA